MKAVYIFVLWTFPYVSIFSQSTFQTYLGYGIPFTESYDILATEDGGFLVSGNTTNTSVDFYVVKLDADGKEVWSFIQDFDQGAYVDAGVHAVELQHTFAILTWTWNVAEDAEPLSYVLHLDKETGRLTHAFSLDFSSDDFYKIVKTNDNDLAFLTYSTSLSEDEIGYAVLALIKTSKYGDIEWIQTYHDDLVAPLFGIEFGDCDLIQTSDKAFYLAAGGFYQDSTMESSRKLTLAKTDSLGNLIWMEKLYGAFLASSISLQSDGVLVTSKFSDEGRAMLYKYSFDGGQLWYKSYESYMEDAVSCVTNNEDELFVMGTSADDACVLLKTTFAGEVLWDKTFSPTTPVTHYESRDMTITQDGGIVITGYLNIPNIIGPAGIFVLRLNRDGEFGDIVSHTEVVLPRFEVSVFPNPTSDVLHIEREVPASEAWSVRLLDTSGKLHYEGQMPDATHTLDMQFLPAGSYFLELRNGRGQVYQKMVVRQ